MSVALYLSVGNVELVLEKCYWPRLLGTEIAARMCFLSTVAFLGRGSRESLLVLAN